MEQPQTAKSVPIQGAKPQWFTVIAIIVLTAGFLLAFFAMAFLLQQRGKLQSGSQTGNASPTPEIIPTAMPFQIELVTPSESELTVFETSVDGIDCQPVAFDPKTTQYTKKTDPGGNPETLYEMTENNMYFSFTKNGIQKENTDKPEVISPYSMDDYIFGCASSSSHVLEITKTVKKSTTRVILFTHVVSYSVLDDNSSIYILYNELIAKTYRQKAIIYNLKTEKATFLPVMLTCMRGDVVVGQNQFGAYNHGPFIMYDGEGNIDQFTGGTNTATFCLFTNEGTLQKVVKIPITWNDTHSNDSSPIGSLTLYKQNMLALYDLGTATPKLTCSLRFVDLTALKSTGLYKLSETQTEDPVCPQATFDFSDVLAGGTKLQYKLTTYDEIKRKLVTSDWYIAEKEE